MKQLVKYLAIGLAIAVGVALAFCYFVWSLHSAHRLVWFVIVAIICCATGDYLSKSDYTTCNNHKGKTDYDKVKVIKMTKWEQAGVVFRTVVGSVIIGALVWTIGYGVACLRDLDLYGLNQDFWEMYLLYGAGSIAIVALAGLIIFKVWEFCSDLIHNRYFAREKAISVLCKLFAILCSVAVGAAIVYYLFPLVATGSK